MREQKVGEKRKDYLLLVAAEYIRENYPEGSLFYDDSDCDGYCIAEECEDASESEL